jgi:hemerythrin superfamily protein
MIRAPPQSRPFSRSLAMTSIAKSHSRKKRVVQDAVQLLTSDHAEVSTLFKKYHKLAETNAEASDRQAHAEQICTLLTIHATIEEEIFYPAARAAGVEDALMDEADVEHAAAKDLIAQIRAMTPDEDHYDAKVKVLGEQIEHHVEEEQERMFPKCRGAGMDLAALGKALAARKDELMREAAEEIA